MQLIQTQTNRIFFCSNVTQLDALSSFKVLLTIFFFFVSNLSCSAHLCPHMDWPPHFVSDENVFERKTGCFLATLSDSWWSDERVEGWSETLTLDRSSVRTHSKVTTPWINSDTCSRFTEAIFRVETHRKNNLRPQTHIWR